MRMRLQAYLTSDLAWRALASFMALPICKIHWTWRRITCTILSIIALLYLGLFIYDNVISYPDTRLFLPRHSLGWRKSCKNRNTGERLLPGATDNLGGKKAADTIVIYNYYDHEGSASNLNFFLQHGLHDRLDTHFLFVISSPLCIKIPDQPNIGVIDAQDGCFAYGAVKAAVHRFGIAEKYENVLVFGSWVRGPFMPMWSHYCWTDAFTHMLDAKHPMVGTGYGCFTPNGNMKPHLHPTLWAFKPVALLPVLAEFHCPHQDELGPLSAQISHYEVLRRMNLSIATMGTSEFPDAPLEHCPQRWLYQPHPYEGIFINPRMPWNLKYPREIDPHNEVDIDTWRHPYFAEQASFWSRYDSRQYCK